MDFEESGDPVLIDEPPFKEFIVFSTGKR